MRRIFQTKYSGNNYWTALLYHQGLPGPGSSPELAINLTVDSGGIQDYALKADQNPIWVTFTPNYSDYMDFYICCNGLYAITNELSNYTSYESDATTQDDLSNSQVYNYSAGSGPDPELRETWYTYLGYQYQGGQTYYVSFNIPFDGTYGIGIYDD